MSDETSRAWRRPLGPAQALVWLSAAGLLYVLGSIAPGPGDYTGVALAAGCAGWAAIGALLAGLGWWLQHRLRLLDADALAVVVIAATVAAIGEAVLWSVAAAAPAALLGAAEEPAEDVVATWIYQVLVLVMWHGYAISVYLHVRRRQERSRGEQAERAARQATLDLLRYQLGPHFLFNALNSIVSLIDDRPKASQELLLALSRLLRRALDADAAAATVADELDAIATYLEIEKARYEDQLRVTVELDPRAAELPLAPFLLQPLVENAIVHGMRTTRRLPLEVSVTCTRLGAGVAIAIENDGLLTPAESGLGRAHVGLANVRQRLAHLHPARHVLTVEQRGLRVRAHLVICDASRELPAKPQSLGKTSKGGREQQSSAALAPHRGAGGPSHQSPSAGVKVLP